MAWTTPKTWSPGEKVTAAMMNTHVRDNLNYLKAQQDAMLLGLPPGSWVADGNFLIWPLTTLPAHYFPFGTTPTVVRTGAGQADTQADPGLGGWGMKMTRGAAAGGIAQALIYNGSLPTLLRGTYFSAGVWCKSAVAASNRLEIYDGIGSSFSAYHDGTAGPYAHGYQWLTATRLIDPSATQLILRMNQDLAGSSYWSGLTGLPGSNAPSAFVVCPAVTSGAYVFSVPGSLTGLGGTTNNAKHHPNRPGLVRWCQLRVDVAPTGAAVVVDINTWDGAINTTMFTTKPTIAISGFVGGLAPDGAYERRCLMGYFGSGTIPVGGFINLDIDTVGSTIAGTGLIARLDIMQYQRPQDIWNAGDKFGA